MLLVCDVAGLTVLRCFALRWFVVLTCCCGVVFLFFVFSCVCVLCVCGVGMLSVWCVVMIGLLCRFVVLLMCCLVCCCVVVLRVLLVLLR